MRSQTRDFSELEREGWQRVAGRYEDSWSGLTRLFIPDLVQALHLTSGCQVLDVACGPGYTAEAALALGAEPVGVDLSEQMVRFARARNPQIEFRVGDAHALPFEGRSFDVVVMNFGVLHLSNPERAFAEAYRVLRAGGRFGFTTWGPPDVSPGARIVDAAVRAHANTDVGIPAGPNYFGSSDPEEYRRVLGGLGFDPGSLELRTVTVEWRIPTASFLFECERDAGVRTAALLAAQTPDALSAIEAQMKESVLAYATPGGFAIPYTAHVVAVTAAG